jgi:hypothetical protein
MPDSESEEPLPHEKDLGEIESDIVGKGLRRIVEKLRRIRRPPTPNPSPRSNATGAGGVWPNSRIVARITVACVSAMA